MHFELPNDVAKIDFLFEAEPKPSNENLRKSIANWCSKKRSALKLIIENYSRVESNSPIFDDESKFAVTEGKTDWNQEYKFIGMHHSVTGKKHGLIRGISKDGFEILEGSFKQDKMHGLKIAYYSDGEVGIHLYKDGDLLSGFRFDASFAEF